LIPSSNASITNVFNAVCVKECPKNFETADCMINSDNEECPRAYFDTVALYTYCIPEKDDLKYIFENVYKQMNEKNNFGKYVADLQLCWKGLAIMAAVTLLISIVYIFLLKWITKPLLYISMVLILAAFCLLGGWCWMQRLKYDPETETKNY